MFDVEDKVSFTSVAVPDKSATGDVACADLDALCVHAIFRQTCDVEPAEVIVPNTGDDAARLSELGYLVNKDRRRATGERASQLHWLPEPMAMVFGHDLDQDLTQQYYRDHPDLLPPLSCDRSLRGLSAVPDNNVQH